MFIFMQYFYTYSIQLSYKYVKKIFHLFNSICIFNLICLYLVDLISLYSFDLILLYSFNLICLYSILGTGSSHPIRKRKDWGKKQYGG